MALLAKNIDPQEHKKEQERINAAKNENTFLKVAERWREKRAREVEETTMRKTQNSKSGESDFRVCRYCGRVVF